MNIKNIKEIKNKLRKVAIYVIIWETRYWDKSVDLITKEDVDMYL